MGWRRLSISDRARGSLLLQDVSGYVAQGGLTAIIGPSSSGKTLLMRALTGRAEQAGVSGEILLHGRPYNPLHARGLVTFERDLLVGVLTLKESLEISMMLRNPLPAAECAKAVLAMMQSLELVHVAHTIIGTVLRRGLSGGQKRRASIGVELISSSGMYMVFIEGNM
jgi:ABC-type multidrug transport system ATPase subunit